VLFNDGVINVAIRQTSESSYTTKLTKVSHITIIVRPTVIKVA